MEKNWLTGTTPDEGAVETIRGLEHVLLQREALNLFSHKIEGEGGELITVHNYLMGGEREQNQAVLEAAQQLHRKQYTSKKFGKSD